MHKEVIEFPDFIGALAVHSMTVCCLYCSQAAPYVHVHVQYITNTHCNSERVLTENLQFVIISYPQSKRGLQYSVLTR